MNDDFKDFDLTPTLSFDVEENSDEKINLAKEEKKEVFKEEEIELSEEEKKMVEAFVEKIDLTSKIREYFGRKFPYYARFYFIFFLFLYFYYA